MAPETRHPELHHHLVRRRGPACQTGAVLGQRNPGRADERFAGVQSMAVGRGLAAGHGHVDQAWREAGGSAAEQSRRRRLGLLRILDAVHRRRPAPKWSSALDWTSFAADGQDTIVLSMVTGMRRATPLLCEDGGVLDAEGSMQRRYEYELLCRLREVLPAGVKVTVVADRGFGDCKLFYALTTELAFEYVIRLRGDIYVTSAGGERRTAGRVGRRRGACAAVGGCSGDRHVRSCRSARSCAYRIR